jgi:MFS family permease
MDRSDPEYLPGTEYAYVDEEHGVVSSRGKQPRTGTGNKLLLPQPSASPNDPLNWGLWRKCWHMLLVCLVTGFTAATSNDAGATQTDLNANLGISFDSFNVGAAILFIGIGYFTLLLSPTASLYGRRIGYLLCILIGLGGAVWFANVRRTSDAIWSQLFVGASEAVAEAQVQLSLADIFFQHQLPGALGLYVVSTSVGTYLGPLIAGYISDNVGWQWVGYTGASVSGFVFVVLFFGLEETYFDRSLFNTSLIEASKVVKESPSFSDSNEKFASERSPTSEPVAELAPAVADAEDTSRSYWKSMALITPATNLVGTGFKQYVRRLWLTLRVFSFPAVIYSGIQWGMQDAWLTFYLTTEDDDWSVAPYNYGDAGVAIMNVPTLIGAIIGCFYGGYLSDYFVDWMAKRNNGVREAEHRLWLMFLTAIISPLGMFLFGIGTAQEWSWPVPYVGLGFIGFGWGCAGDLSMSYLVDAYPQMVLEGMVGVSVINNTLGMIFSLACNPWIDSLGVQNSYIAVGVVNFVVMMLTAPMIIYGKKCRKLTKNMYYRFIEQRDGM